MRWLKRLDDDAEKWLLLGFYVMLVLTMAIEVLRREIFAYSSIWGEEIVRYSFIYLAWIGAAAAIKERAHLRIDVILHYLGTRGKAFIYLIGDIVVFAVAIVALYTSFETVLVAAEFGSVSHGLRVPMLWFLLAVPIGFTLLLVRLVQATIQDVHALRTGRDLFEGNRLFD